MMNVPSVLLALIMCGVCVPTPSTSSSCVPAASGIDDGCMQTMRITPALDENAARAFWTDERIRDILLRAAAPPPVTGDSKNISLDGEPAPQPNPVSPPQLDEAPYNAIGRLVVMFPDGLGEANCTAQYTKSSYTITTAAHCIIKYDSATNAFVNFTSAVFLPAFSEDPAKPGTYRISAKYNVVDAFRFKEFSSGKGLRLQCDQAVLVTRRFDGSPLPIKVTNREHDSKSIKVLQAGYTVNRKRGLVMVRRDVNGTTDCSVMFPMSKDKGIPKQEVCGFDECPALGALSSGMAYLTKEPTEFSYVVAATHVGVTSTASLWNIPGYGRPITPQTVKLLMEGEEAGVEHARKSQPPQWTFVLAAIVIPALYGGTVLVICWWRNRVTPEKSGGVHVQKGNLEERLSR